ncbi:MAG: mannose-1-phosphate guanylyltransferase/mannose-6-phosphate isomerase [Kiloniellales bacterium]|nr:mannose-1-phosphate guanylyltransferase/mannose-6-phosphate isomerase [Kiloniellales bacterium]
MTQAPIQPVILCGGIGSRLWPVSRATAGKPFADLLGGTSLFRKTLERVGDPARFAPPIVVCNEAQRFLAAEQLRAAGRPAAALILEPAGRNTAPAIAAAALAAVADPGELLLVLPSDHVIEKPERFLAAVDAAAPAAAAGWLMTFGVTPDHPETGYGYIERGEALPDLAGCRRIARFVEKPDRATAEAYLAGGRHLWNSGIFLFSRAGLLAELEARAPEVLQAARAAVEGATPDLDFTRLEAAAFATAPRISIDYALMEKTERAGVVPVDMGWSDVGSWESLWRASAQDADGNVLLGEVLVEDSHGSYLRSDAALLVAVGLRDLVVVVQEDAVLVCPRDRAQEVRGIAERLAAEGRSEHGRANTVQRPWGSFTSLQKGEGFQSKHLMLKPGARISLQRHRHRSEHWVVVRGRAEVTRGEEVFALAAGQSTFIPQGSLHRLRNPGAAPLHVIEVQCGSYLEEDDIERIADDYGRS